MAVAHLCVIAILLGLVRAGDIYINVGGGILGNSFRCDSGRYASKNSKTMKSKYPSSGGPMMQVGNTIRYAPTGDLIYSIPVPKGKYMVHLWFKELDSEKEEEDRSFYVKINGALIKELEEYEGQPLDVVDAVDQNLLFLNTHMRSSVNGKITITLGRVEGNPILAGLAIIGKNADGIIGNTDKYKCGSTSAPENNAPKPAPKPKPAAPKPEPAPMPKPAAPKPTPSPKPKPVAPMPVAPKQKPPAPMPNPAAPKPMPAPTSPTTISTTIVPTISKWTKVAEYPFPVAEGAGGMMNGYWVAFGGMTKGYKDTTTLSYALPVKGSKKWIKLANMPGLYTHMAQVINGRYLYGVGAYLGVHPKNPPTKHGWRYDIVTNKWMRLPDLPLPRGTGAMALVAKRWLVFTGGSVRTNYPSKPDVDRSDTWSLDTYNMGAGWKKQPSIPQKRNHFGAVTTCGRSFFIGGQAGDNYGGGNLKDVHEYIPCGKGSGKWMKRASLPVGIGHTATGLIPYKCGVIVVGGITNNPKGGWGTHRTEVLWYNPALDKWYEIGKYPKTVFGPLCGIYDNNKLMCGVGESQNKAPKDILVTTLSDKVVPCGFSCKQDYEKAKVNANPWFDAGKITQCF